MPIEFDCDSCRRRITQPAELAGQHSSCPWCDHPVIVPAAAAEVETGLIAVRPAPMPFTFQEQIRASESPRWSCPHCQGWILEAARVCRYCKKEVDYLRPDCPREAHVRAHLHASMSLVARWWIVLAITSLIVSVLVFGHIRMVCIIGLLLAVGWSISAVLAWQKNSSGLVIGLMISYSYAAGVLAFGLLSPCAGVTFVPVAVLILLAHAALGEESELANLKAASIRAAAEQSPEGDEMRPCPRCGETVASSATCCHFCTTDFGELDAKRKHAEHSFVGWVNLTAFLWAVLGTLSLFGAVSAWDFWTKHRQLDAWIGIFAMFPPVAWFGLAIALCTRQVWALRVGIGLSILLLMKFFLELSLMPSGWPDSPRIELGAFFGVVLTGIGLVSALVASGDHAARQR